MPDQFETIIIAPDAKSRERALMLIQLYDVFATDPRPERLAEFLSPDYVQHSSMAPDGPDGIGMVFSVSVKQYPVKLDVHKVMVVGDWAMAHVNFRNLEKPDEGDLGSTAVDMFTFGPDGKLTEHWDAVQGIPTYSVPPKQGMFRRVQDHPVWPYETVAPIIPAKRDIPQKRWWEPTKEAESAAGKLGSTIAQTGESPAVHYDRQKIDISNLRDFYDGLLIADVMIHADAMFDAETKWALTLFQMIQSGSRHHQARCAFQLAYMGMPMPDILGIWSPDYVDTIGEKRTQAAFKYVQAASLHPAKVTADTHAMLRTHFVDRQIAELFELTAINAAVATHDLLVPIATDQNTLDWATANLAEVGWEPGNNLGTPEEQRKNLFAGEVLETAYRELLATWKPEDLTAADPKFETDWVNYLTGYDVSMVTFDSDRDGIEDPFDEFPEDFLKWKRPGLNDEKLPAASTARFDIEAFDYEYFQPAVVPEAKTPFSDRHRFDTEWTRQTGFGTIRMDSYFSSMDRALDIETKWSTFLVYQLAAGCTHCQVHGAYGTFDAIEEDFPSDEIPEDVFPKILKKIHALFDFERSDLFTEAEKAAYRLARDAGPIPTRVTPAHVEEMRRHFSDREIQEYVATLVCSAWLSTVMQSQQTVTDRLSMSWALRHLTPIGWKPGAHIGLPQEQRPFHMTELTDLGMADMSQGEVTDYSSEWIGIKIPLAVDRDRDGVDDTFDGFPNDPDRWEDTDRDGVEDSMDDDIDGDGISNQDEIAAGTFPYKADSDGDGIDDAAERKAGTDPVDPRSL